MAMRSALWRLIFCYLISTVLAFDGSAPACQDTDYGRSCTLPAQVEILTMLQDKLMVGCSNSLASFSLDLQVDKHIDLTPAQSIFDDCVGFGPGQRGNDKSQCTNFVKVIERVPGSSENERVMVCGTNAFRPKCTLHSVSNISSYEYMTDSHHIDEGFSPYSDDSQIVAILTSNGRYFSGTKFDVYAAPQTIGMAPYPLQRDNMFTVQVPTSDPQWLKQPTFVSSYEIGNHVYFFLREPAYEIDQGESVVYSRAVRICKNDNGTATDPQDPSNVFLTFQKARMVCSSRSQPASVNSIPYNYDNLQSTFLWTSPDGQQFVYGVFTSPTNGPSGSAICKFSFDPNLDGSLTKVFEDGNYLVRDDNQPTWRKMSGSPFVCPGESSGPQRSISDASRYQLMYSPVTALQPEPIYTMLGKRLTNIAVDVIDYNGESQTIIYFATAEGDIQQLIMGDDEERHEAMILRVGGRLSDLTVRKNDDETRYLYATTEDRVLSITLGNCASYVNCFECLDSRDAYCGWDEEGAGSCQNKIEHNSSSFLQSALAHEDNITRVCGARPDVPIPSTQVPPACQSSIPQSSDPSVVSQTEENRETTTDQKGTNCVNTVGGLSPREEKSISVPDLVGATVGAFVIGIPVGAFVCFVFLKVFVVPRRHKHAINRQRRANQREEETGGLNQVNNHLSGEDQQQIQKKELSLKENPRYSQAPIAMLPPPIQSKTEVITLAPVPTGNSHSSKHKRTNSKDINTYDSPEDDDTFDDKDQVPPLRSISSCSGSSYANRGGSKPNGHSHTMNGVHRKRVPGYKVPRGRTDSTTWLRANSNSSEPPSPLESPISDV